jgi:hypothetical protein
VSPAAAPSICAWTTTGFDPTDGDTDPADGDLPLPFLDTIERVRATEVCSCGGGLL